ncbi:MAG: ABC transporter permease, partial [Candidatus Kerfeldbacteria bacterium]|nr:ABC transporter permease [Candidatus Kerfeldbacteria bacterium]
IWKKEIIDNLRDRRTIVTSLLVPIVLMPVILVGTFKLQESQIKGAAAKVAKVAIVNPDNSPALTAFLTAQDKIQVTAAPAEIGPAIDAGQINVVVIVPPELTPNLAAKLPTEVEIRQKSSNYDSAIAVEKVAGAIQRFSQQQAIATLEERGIPASALATVIAKPVDITSAEERGGYFLGLLLPMLLVVFAIIGGMYIAIDISAGEKERKTLEALLLTPVPRLRLVLGQFLAVASMATATIVLSVASLYVSFKVVPPPDLGPGFDQLAINLAWPTLLLMLLIGVILAIMFSGLLLSVAIFAKSYKEAQNYISPFYLLAVLPVSIANSLPGFKPTLPMFLVPGMNAVFVLKEVLVGTFDAAHITVTLVSLVVAAGIGIIAATKIYSKESILFRD